MTMFYGDLYEILCKQVFNGEYLRTDIAQILLGPEEKLVYQTSPEILVKMFGPRGDYKRTPDKLTPFCGIEVKPMPANGIAIKLKPTP